MFGFYWVVPLTVDGLIPTSFLGEGVLRRAKTICQGAIFGGLWILWTEYNSWIFDDHYSSFQDMWDILTFLAILWAEAYENYCNHSLAEVHWNWGVIIYPPTWLIFSIIFIVYYSVTVWRMSSPLLYFSFFLLIILLFL